MNPFSINESMKIHTSIMIMFIHMFLKDMKFTISIASILRSMWGMESMEATKPLQGPVGRQLLCQLFVVPKGGHLGTSLRWWFYGDFIGIDGIYRVIWLFYDVFWRFIGAFCYFVRDKPMKNWWKPWMSGDFMGIYRGYEWDLASRYRTSNEWIDPLFWSPRIIQCWWIGLIG